MPRAPARPVSAAEYYQSYTAADVDRMDRIIEHLQRELNTAELAAHRLRELDRTRDDRLLKELGAAAQDEADRRRDRLDEVVERVAALRAFLCINAAYSRGRSLAAGRTFAIQLPFYPYYQVKKS